MSKCFVPTVVVITLIFCCSGACNGLDILGVFTTPARSHAQLGRALMNALASNGHTVTLISPYARRPSDNFTVLHVEQTHTDGNWN